jgi:hypothetical protein
MAARSDHAPAADLPPGYDDPPGACTGMGEGLSGRWRRVGLAGAALRAHRQRTNFERRRLAKVSVRCQAR